MGAREQGPIAMRLRQNAVDIGRLAFKRDELEERMAELMVARRALLERLAQEGKPCDKS